VGEDREYLTLCTGGAIPPMPVVLRVTNKPALDDLVPCTRGQRRIRIIMTSPNLLPQH
jgi:hypothetical protein